MSREIRRVPPGWEHPRDESTGHYRPLLDNDYDTAARAWIADLVAWESGADVLPSGRDIASNRQYCRYYWEYAGDPPDADYHRPKWSADEATYYQVYETVSEGTPVSPVFESLDAMIVWLVNEAGYSQVAAERFAKEGWAMSAIYGTGRGLFASDIETYLVLPPKPDQQ